MDLLQSLGHKAHRGNSHDLSMQIFQNNQCRYFHFGFNFASTDIGKQKEDLVYPPVSFISELGGSLGLFVGFSFLTIWDCIDYMIERSKTVKDYFV